MLRFVGDRVQFSIKDTAGQTGSGWRAKLRTNLGLGDAVCKEIIQAYARKLPLDGTAWHDLPMRADGEGWTLELPLIEPGFFSAKPYLIEPDGWQHWPDGPDVGISVHPDAYRTANTIYCAFTRMFGATRTAARAENEKLEAQLKQFDALGYTVIPPSGKFRDLVKQLPHIVDTLGCRILHLLPVNPVPTTYARFGRFGSPYASLDLTAIDPTLVEFDRLTTGVDQFRELTYATHLKGARVFLDIVTNHTGWGSALQENRPEWFERTADGSFASPGAWGTTWEDLIELDHEQEDAWEVFAEALLVWCRRGVDGFRCDAGYKVPAPAWQYITARVRQEFPETIFLLEGLGGAWETTEALLTEGGMQWAYSELFQNYSPVQVSGYLDHSIKQSQRVGVLVHYSETHDNERLAQRGRLWSLSRNRLCALTSTNGGFGFTCGVEWLAAERVNVHSSRGLAWDNRQNIVPELTQLNRLLANHPCFFDGAKLTRISAPDSPVFVLRRDSEEGKDSVLVLANTDAELPRKFTLDDEALGDWGADRCELLGQVLPATKANKDGTFEFTFSPGACFCLSPRIEPQGVSGEIYRRARARAAWATQALGQLLPIESIPATPWLDLANWMDDDPASFLTAVSAHKAAAEIGSTTDAVLSRAGEAVYQPVVNWSLPDQRRILIIPPNHWLFIRDTAPFRATLTPDDGRQQHAISIAVRDGHIACFAPGQPAGDAQLQVERFPTPRSAELQLGANAAKPIAISEPASTLLKPETTLSQPDSTVRAPVRFLAPDPKSLLARAERKAPNGPQLSPLEQPLVLLTNGIGGMARICVDLGAVKSKYDCLLAANLNSRLPVDRHVFAKRARVWINANGFITPLNLRNLAFFEPGPPAIWRFVMQAGICGAVELEFTATMLNGRNTTVLHFERTNVEGPKLKPLPDGCDVRLTVRIDIEDRNFHSETKRNAGADYHFSTNTHTLIGRPGFAFTPASDRQLRVFSIGGIYHDQPEWCENIAHPVEQSRGQTASGDAYSPGWFDLPLDKGASVSIVLCADSNDPDSDEIRRAASENFQDGSRQRERTDRALLDQKSNEHAEQELCAPNAPFDANDAFGQQLLRATRAFVVRRDDGVTVIAGYPWFLDWGRDSLICARGLLAAGMVEQVKQLLVSFGRFARNGTLPNTIHGDDASNRDTSDAPLWYGIVCEEAASLLGDSLYQVTVDQAGRRIASVLFDIATGYLNGTPNGIRVDAESGLVWSPSHFTWMDTNFPAGTPREGYPIEIQALWIRLLRQLSRISPNDAQRWSNLADRALASLQKRFWLGERGWFADLLIAKSGQPAASAQVDNALRSNCLLPISLGLVSGEPARRCVTAAIRHLVVPGALRSLAPLPVSPPLPIFSPQGQLLNNPPEPYWGRYEGDEDTRRKPAYHNGTVWTWTFPIFCEALALAWERSPTALAAAKAYLGSMDRLLETGCLGQIPEILDGDAPHTQRGCDAQAWGVTEALRVWKFLTCPPSTWAKQPTTSEPR
jgi:starch synthase (maltosyl-transferring)